MRLRIKDLSFSYDSIKAIDNVSMEINEGEVLGIIGPNGAGKSTLLKCINSILKPRVGTVLVDGEDILKLRKDEVAKRVAMVPQNSLTSFPFTVLDVVLMGRIPHLGKLGRESERDLKIAEEAMRTTFVLSLADRSVDELSGGEFRRVIIAMALAQEPSILLLDEPTLHLDISHQLGIMELIRRLTAEKKLATILVSHDLNLAAKFCDKLILLNSGKIYSAGSVEEVLNRENIKQVYGVEAQVIRSNGLVYVIPIKPI
ncbi:MAG: ABC transporter ATP-binding protein [Nitrososphaerales archaeon]